jgi:DNA polymerase III subunit delta
MAVVKPQDVLGLVSGRREPPAVLLIHGADRSAVFDLCKSILAKLTVGGNDLSVSRLTDAQRDRLYTEVFSASMFGGRQAVWLSASGDASVAAVEQVLAAAERGNPLVIDSDGLAKSSRLRKLCEASDLAVAVAVYEESLHELRERIGRIIREAGLAIEPDAMALLLDLASRERGVAASEVEKLVTYAAGRTAIAVDDIRAISGDMHEATLDELLDAVFEGDMVSAERFALALDASGGRNILSSALTHAARLEVLALQVTQGQSPESVVKAPANAIFFKRQPAVARELRLWSLERLLEAEGKIAAGILQARRNRELESAIVNRTLLAVSWLARSQSA